VIVNRGGASVLLRSRVFLGRDIMPKRFAAVAFTLLFSSSAFAADLRSEIVNAGEHAEYAGEATNIAEVHLHLHHALNCLVGPKGAGFDKSQMNPCVNSGNGIIPDATDPKMIAIFQSAAARAREGLATDDLAAAKADATAAAKAIVGTLKGIK
jgi:hypothetical protein